MDRLLQLANLPNEPGSSEKGLEKSAHWMKAPDVCFDDVVLRYRPQDKPALDRISLSIQAGQRIGIVGRTGSGKSSLLNALFRMFPLERGSIAGRFAYKSSRKASSS